MRRSALGDEVLLGGRAEPHLLAPEQVDMQVEVAPLAGRLERVEPLLLRLQLGMPRVDDEDEARRVRVVPPSCSKESSNTRALPSRRTAGSDRGAVVRLRCPPPPRRRR